MHPSKADLSQQLRDEIVQMEHRREAALEQAKKELALVQYQFAAKRINSKFNAIRSNIKRKINKLMTDPLDPIVGSLFVSEAIREDTTYTLRQIVDISEGYGLDFRSQDIVVTHTGLTSWIWKRVTGFNFVNIEKIVYKKNDLTKTQKDGVIKRVLKKRSIRA